MNLLEAAAFLKEGVVELFHTRTQVAGNQTRAALTAGHFNVQCIILWKTNAFQLLAIGKDVASYDGAPVRD